MLQNARAKMRGKEGKVNFRITSAIHMKDLKKTGKHSFPYINSVRSK